VIPGSAHATLNFRTIPGRTRELVSEIQAVASGGRVWPAPVTTCLFQAGTDAFAWRSRGIPVYGFYLYPISADDLTRMHGNNERMPVDSLEQGTQVIYKTLQEVAAK
jgi:acetylornithine deacetylase/succinyl-diaminopimelate desuccinylase-like protein